ncbi:MAG TPA: TonB-dependent receptor [Rhizomicrobium sp.]|nr:TonB-dependent receptor [Rhizomicrobium sp.]
MIRTFSVSTSILALVCCSAAYAQTAAPAQPATNEAGVEQVVVTAERRVENLQKTSISATVLSGEDITNKNIVTVDQLQFSAPSVAVDNFGQGNDFNIRGIGKGEHNSQTSTGVITYRDGVETYPGYIQEEPYYDISSIEILRGPQGTIVGANATGGAVFVNTNNPEIGGGFDGYVMGNVANYNEVGSQGAVNIPIDDTLAARFSYFADRRDSFYTITDANPADNCPHHKYDGCKPGYNPGDVRWAAGRMSLLWKPVNALTVLFKIDTDYLNNGGYPADPASFATLDPFHPIPNKTDPFHISANAPEGAIDRFYRASLKVDYVFDNGITLRSISAWQDSNSRYRADLDGTDSSIPFSPDETFYDTVDTSLGSEELNLISPDTGRVTWVLGGFAQWLHYNFLPPYQFDIDLYQPIFIPAFNYQLQGTNPESTYAVFGNASIKLMDDLKLDVGGRYTTHTTKNDVDVLQYGTFIKDVQSASDTNFSYKVALDWNLNDDNFLYGFVATGFKPGGLNVPVGFGQPAPFKGETVTSFETGWKSTLLDGHLVADLDAYYNDFHNFQVTIGYPNFPTFGFEVNNPNTTKIYGFEGEATAVFGQFEINGGIGIMHSSLGTFYASDPRITISPVPCDPKTGPATIFCTNLGGHPQSYAPDFTFNISAQYTFEMGDLGRLTPRVNFGHVSDQWATLFDRPDFGDRLDPRNILGAQLAWQYGSWTATLYGMNLTDQHYIAAMNSNIRWAGSPRQFGFSLSKTF